jgi:hypothetical protein
MERPEEMSSLGIWSIADSIIGFELRQPFRCGENRCCLDGTSRTLETLPQADIRGLITGRAVALYGGPERRFRPGQR